VFEPESMLGTFLVEAYENLDKLDRDLLLLEQDAANPRALAQVFRTIHTIKASSGFLGFDKLGGIAHVGENLLHRLREGDLVLDEARTTVLLRTGDAIREILECVEQTGEEGDGSYIDLVQEICLLGGEDDEDDEDEIVFDLDEVVLDGGESGLDLAEVVLDGGESGLGDAENQRDTEPFIEAAAAHLEGDVLTVPPGSEAGEAASPPVADGAGVLESPSESVPSPLSESPELVSRQEDVSPQVSALATAPRTSPTREVRSSLSESTIRVDVELLDKLMNLVGELVLARNEAVQHAAESGDPAVMATSQRINMITTELQENMMKTRMQPVGNVWEKLPRVVRDLSVETGKQVQVEMDGRDTGLDKTIIEAIQDPLMHLVRNAVDHGIEMPEIRMEQGKSPAGHLALKAYHEGGHAVIEVADDGCGIEMEKVRHRIIARGLASAERTGQMTDRELLRFIFLPGFSTADKVTNVSGRGVGLDVVKADIEAVGGVVEIESSVGQGSTFRVKIPLTLAIIPALIVQCAQDRYAIPQVNLSELVRLEGAEIEQIEVIQNAPVYRLRGNLLPLVSLGEELGLHADFLLEAKTALAMADEDAVPVVNIVVLQSAACIFGLVVDRIVDTEEIVVKPLGSQLAGIKRFSGATIMGDGKVALILDTLGLASVAHVTGESESRRVAPVESSAQKEIPEAVGSFLLFTVGGTNHLAVHMDRVSRIEEITPAAIEVSGGHEVVQYRGEILPLARLAGSFGLDPASASLPAGDEWEEETAHSFLDDRSGGLADEEDEEEAVAETFKVVLCAEGERKVGLIVDRITDIVEQEISIEQVTRRHGILGSAVIQGQVTDLLDTDAVLREICASSSGEELPFAFPSKNGAG